jgi:hypothetical protein
MIRESMKEDAPGIEDLENMMYLVRETMKEDALGKRDHEEGCTW